MFEKQYSALFNFDEEPFRKNWSEKLKSCKLKKLALICEHVIKGWKIQLLMKKNTLEEELLEETVEEIY